MSQQPADAGEEVHVIARVPRSVRDEAQKKTAHGEVSRAIRSLLREIAEGDADGAVETIPVHEHASVECDESLTDAERRRETFRRDDWRCRNCGTDLTKDTARHVHHIVPDSVGGESHLGNLVALCGECHTLAHRR